MLIPLIVMFITEGNALQNVPFLDMEITQQSKQITKSILPNVLRAFIEMNQSSSSDGVR